MAITNQFSANTVGTTQQVASCLEKSARSAAFELNDEQFLLLVIDSLNRKAVAGGAGNFPNVSTYTACDGEEAAHNAKCALEFLSPPFNTNVGQLKQIILWQLNQSLV